MRSRIVLSSFMLLLAMACISSTAFAASAASPSISIQTLKYEPYPAEPGKYFDIWINVENSGLGRADKFTFILNPSYPFSLDSGENATRYFGSIEASDNALLKYRVRVAPDAVEGYNKLDYMYQYGSSGIWVSNNLSVYIQTSDAVISIDNVSTVPAQMAPGKASELGITLSNIADSPLKDVTVSLDLSSLTFFPTGTGTEQKVYLMESGASRTFIFNLVAGPSMDAGIYKIPMAITYRNLLGDDFSLSDYATVVVGDVPEITVGVETTTVLAAGDSGTVTLNVINKGLTGVKLLSISILPSNDFVVLSPSPSTYIGSIDSDGYETAEYSVYVNPSVQGNLAIPVSLDYRDDNNNNFTEIRNVELKLYSQEDIARYGLRIQGGIAIWVIILILVIVAYLVYTRVWKKRSRR